MSTYRVYAKVEGSVGHTDVIKTMQADSTEDAKVKFSKLGYTSFSIYNVIKVKN